MLQSKKFIQKLQDIVFQIQEQIEFTRIYQDLGSHEPRWFVLDEIMPRSFTPVSITIMTDLHDISLYADPMLEKVFFNLLDNSLRHGGTVSHILVSGIRHPDGYTISWEDNGTGVRDVEKEAIFDRGHGKHTGLGLFLVREILALTGISITETGTEGKGARFDISIPNGVYADAIASPVMG